MTMEDIRNLKKGDKFWIPRYSGLSGEFQRRILGLEITCFNLIEVTFDHFPDDCWYYIKPTPPIFPGHKPHDGYMCWYKVKVQGLMVDMHTSSTQDNGFFSKIECQAVALKSLPWEIKTPNDYKLLDESREIYPEWFL